MTTNNKFYVLLEIKNNSEDNKKIMNILTKIFKKETYQLIDLKENLFAVSFETIMQLAIFINSFSAITMDNPSLKRGLIIPKNDECFYPYIEEVKEGSIEYLYNIIKQEDYVNFYHLISDIDVEILSTIKNFIELNNSPSISSIATYSHKNTVTYRVSNFIENTSLDVDLFYNRLFVLQLTKDYLKNLETN